MILITVITFLFFGLDDTNLMTKAEIKEAFKHMPEELDFPDCTVRRNGELIVIDKS